MKIVLKELTIRNFLSFGNVSQTIKLDSDSFRIITGQNKDKSDNEEDKNGVGKSSIQLAIHYALFGKSTGNRIVLGQMINNINKKNMLVSLKFDKDDIHYEIIRGRSPNVLKLLRNGENIIDESQGDSRETQKDIEKIIGFDDDLYNQLFNLTCLVPLFLSQNTSSQKAILEKILGIDIISKKIVLLKDMIKSSKNDLNNEVFKYNTIKQQNDNLSASIEKQTIDMNNAKKKWLSDIQSQIIDIKQKIESMSKIDIQEEIKNFQLLEEYLKQEGVNLQNQQLIISLNNQIKQKEMLIQNYQLRIDNLLRYDFDTERQNILYNEQLNKEKMAYDIEENQYRTLKTFKEQNLDYNFQKISKEIERKKNELANIKENICPTCGQPINVEDFNKLKESKKEEINHLQEELHKIDMEILNATHIISSFVPKKFEFKVVSFNDLNSLLEKENEINQLKQQMDNIVKEKNDLIEQAKNVVIIDLGNRPTTHYKEYSQALQHQAVLNSLQESLQRLEITEKTNPFEQQEKSIEEMKKNMMVLDDSEVKRLEKSILYQETLLKLLNNPSSFIRKTILDKSLEYLNSRIKHYLEQMGSMHLITFNNDMSITISKMGVEYGYISSGEEGRVSMALTFAFRDVWESLNNCNVNLWFFDEVIDRLGLDDAGVDLLVDMIKSKKDKNVLMVTHNGRLINQTNNIIKLVKENDFTKVCE